jgi:hypothetical protein
MTWGWVARATLTAVLMAMMPPLAVFVLVWMVITER